MSEVRGELGSYLTGATADIMGGFVGRGMRGVVGVQEGIERGAVVGSGRDVGVPERGVGCCYFPEVLGIREARVESHYVTSFH